MTYFYILELNAKIDAIRFWKSYVHFYVWTCVSILPCIEGPTYDKRIRRSTKGYGKNDSK